MNRIAKILLTLILAFGIATPIQAAEVEIQAGVFGGTLYQMSYAFTEVLKVRAPSIKATAVETQGSATGIVKAFAEPKKRVVAGTLVPFLEAREGVAPYKQAYPGLKIIGNVSENIQTLITYDPNIKTIADLKGKRVGLGPRPTVLGKTHGAIVAQGVGVNVKDMKYFYMDWGSMRDGMMDGSIDAMILGVSTRPNPPYVPVAVYGEMLASRGAPNFISIPASAVEKASKLDSIDYETKNLPAGSIAPGVPAQETAAWHDLLGFFAFDELDDEIAYTLAKVLYENCDELVRYSAAARGVWPELVVPTVAEELIHPGALRFYKEKGLR